MGEAYHTLFQLKGTCSAPRFAGQVLAGLEMALWDVMGKAVGRPVHELLGGKMRDEVHYFGFPQGETAEELATQAARFADGRLRRDLRQGGAAATNSMQKSWRRCGVPSGQRGACGWIPTSTGHPHGLFA